MTYKQLIKALMDIPAEALEKEIQINVEYKDKLCCGEIVAVEMCDCSTAFLVGNVTDE